VCGDCYISVVLNWSINDVFNAQLLVPRMRRISHSFDSASDYFGVHYPFILEETRSAVARYLEHNYDEIVRCTSSLRIGTKTDGPATCRIGLICNPETFDLKRLPPSFALFVQNFSGEMRNFAVELKKTKHFFIFIQSIHYDGNDCDDIGSGINVCFKAKMRYDMAAQVDNKWNVFLLPDMQSTTWQRVCDALSVGVHRCPLFMDDILTGTFKYSAAFGSKQDLLRRDEVELKSICSSLNDSQERAIENVLSVGELQVPHIQLIKGPPGTINAF
jgi:hypothetical protein